MTIAVSSVVKPSKLLIAAIVAMCAVAAAAISGAVLPRAGVPPYQAHAAGIAVAGLVALLCGLHLGRNGKAWKIDISGTGQIRLGRHVAAGTRAHAPGLVRLLENSTLWPNLLLLRLRSEDGAIIILPVLRDSVRADDFRALAAALRWIALRQPEERRKNL